MPTSGSGSIVIHFPQVIGIYINGVDYTDYVLSYEFKEKQNQSISFFAELIDIGDAEKVDVAEGNDVQLRFANNLKFKCRIDKPNYKTYDFCTIQGEGTVETILKNTPVEWRAGKSGCDEGAEVNKPIYSGTTSGAATTTIVQGQLSGVSSVSIGTNTYLGNLVARSENDNTLSFLAGMAGQMSGVWWGSYGSYPYENNYFNVGKQKGSLTSVFTFNTTGNNQNANETSREVDEDALWNSVTLLGYGDGNNQLKSKVFHATDNFTRLLSGCSSTDTIITVEDDSILPSAGVVWIGMEQVTYADSWSELADYPEVDADLLDLAWDGTNLWGIDRSSNKLYKIDSSDGTEITHYNLNNRGWCGLTYLNDYLYAADYDTNKIYKLDPSDGTEISSWDTPGTAPYGLANDGIYFYSCEITTGTIYKLTTSGDIVDSWVDTDNFNTITGLTWENGVLWGCNVSPDKFLQLSFNTKTILLKNSTTDANQYGLTFDGNYIWSTGHSNNKLYKYQKTTTSNIIEVIRSKKDTIDSNDQKYLKAYAHSKGVAVYDAQYLETSRDGNSKIDDDGLQQKTIVDKGVLDQDALDQAVVNLLIEHYILKERIKIIPSDLYETLSGIDVGDIVTATDSESGLTGDYTVVGQTLKNTEGLEEIEYELGNVTSTFTQDLSSTQEEIKIGSQYMQGSTTAFNVQSYENCDSSNPLNIKIYLPDDLIRINKAILSFDVKDYRSYTTGSYGTSVNTSSSTNFSVWDRGQELDTSSTPLEISASVPAVFFGEYVACSINVLIMNQSGSTDNYNYQVNNVTKSSVLASWSSQTIPNNDGQTRQILVGGSFAEVGDVIQLHIDDGIIGTDTNSADEAIYRIELSAVGSHAHDMDYSITTSGVANKTVDLKIGPEGSEGLVDNGMVSGVAYDITDWIVSGIDLNTGNWRNIQIVPQAGNPVRIEANIYIKCFIQAK